MILIYLDNNYKLPKSTSNIKTTIHYWYADKEEKRKKKDICFMKERFPETKFTVLSNLGHGGFVLLKPEIFVKMIDTLK